MSLGLLVYESSNFSRRMLGGVDNGVCKTFPNLSHQIHDGHSSHWTHQVRSGDSSVRKYAVESSRNLLHWWFSWIKPNDYRSQGLTVVDVDVCHRDVLNISSDQHEFDLCSILVNNKNCLTLCTRVNSVSHARVHSRSPHPPRKVSNENPFPKHSVLSLSHAWHTQHWNHDHSKSHGHQKHGDEDDFHVQFPKIPRFFSM